METISTRRVTNGSGCDAQVRHGNASTCQSCGEPITPERGSRRQRFCSRSCKKRSYSNAKYASATPPADRGRSVKNSHANSNGCKAGLAGRGSVGKALWRSIVETEVFANRAWSEVVSADGVRSEVTALRPRALRGVP